MSTDALFCILSSTKIAELIRSANRSVCYAGPGIQEEVAKAILSVSSKLGAEMLTVSLDFDERVMRMGYGSIVAVSQLRDAGILVQSAHGLRTALVIADDTGFIFTPTPLYLEAEPVQGMAPNAMRMSREQVAEALARLSPAAKVIAVAQAKSPQEKRRIESLPVDVGSAQVTEEDFVAVQESLKEAPPVRFDLARQVRVFEPYLQYVELSMSGVSIQRHRLKIPKSIQKLGDSQELVGRLHTSFDLIERGELSPRPLENVLTEIRNNFTRSLGKDHGRVLLKQQKSIFQNRLDEFRESLKKYQKSIEEELQQNLNNSFYQIVEYYVPLVMESPPDALLGGLSRDKPTEEDARLWLGVQLERIFPSAESLISKMKIEEHYKDVTYETLNQEDFIREVKAAFPAVDWDKAYNEFKAVGESKK
ncbi:MAG: hypothetical protein ACLQHK_13795 [Gallionellaceae bacterium]